MKLEYILNKGCVKELELDLCSISRTDDLLQIRYSPSHVNEVLRCLNSSLGVKYDIDDVEIKTNHLIYIGKTFEARQ
jgi:hypothetical protein